MERYGISPVWLSLASEKYHVGWVNLCYHGLSQTSYLKRGGHIIIFPKLHTFYKTI
jgi:hypothetical protein